MRALRVFCALLFLSASLYAVPKFFFVRTNGTPDGAQYDAKRSLIYVSSPQTSQVLAVSPDTGEIQKSVYIPNAGGLDITPDGKQIVVGTTAFYGWYGNGFLTFVDLDTFTVAEHIPISNPITEATGQRTVFSPYIRKVVALYNGNILFTVSPPDSTETWIGEYYPATHVFKLVAPASAAVMVPSDDRKQVLLPDMGFAAGLELFDEDADAITLCNPELKNSWVAFSHDRKFVAYIGGQRSTLILDASTLQPVRTITTPTAGFQAAFSLDNSKIYIQKFAYPAFYVVDVNTGLIEGALSMPSDPHEMFKLLGMDSRGYFYSSLDGGLAVSESTYTGYFEPPLNAASFPYVAVPSAGPISGGTAVTLRSLYQATPTVYFADKLAILTGADANGIRVISPAGNRPGPVDVTIKFDDGHITYIPEGFSYGPAIEYLDRNGGSTAGGDTVTISALGLRSNTATGVQVQIGGASATVNSIGAVATSPAKSPTYRINVTTPSGTAGAADVVLTTPDGSSTLKGGFSYVPMTKFSAGTAVTHMLYDDVRNYVYRCNNDINSVSVVDPNTGETLKQYLTHAGPVAMALSPDRNTLYVTTVGPIDAFDLNTGERRSIFVAVPSGMSMTRIGATSKGTLFVGIFNPAVMYDSRIIEVNATDGSFVTRVSNLNGNYAEIGMSRDGTRAFLSSDLDAGASGNYLYYWDAFSDSVRKQFVPGWSDFAVDDSAQIFIGGATTYDSLFNIHNVFQSFDDEFRNDPFVWGEKLDDSGALAFQPSQTSLYLFDLHGGNRVARIALPAQPIVTLDGMAVDSIHGNAFITTTTGLLKVGLQNFTAIGRLEPAQGLSSGGQKIVVKGIGFQQHATVTIGGQAAATTFVNAATLEVLTPALPLGNYAVTVTNDDGRTYTLSAAYSSVDTQPILSGSSPAVMLVSNWGSYQGTAAFGMNFAPGAVVLWNGTPRTTYFVDDTELRFDPVPADTAVPGAATLTVRNPDGGLSNEITVPIKNYPQVTLPSFSYFATQLVNTASALQTGTVQNNGTDPVQISFSTEAPFTLATDCPPTIAAGANCKVSVGFSPTSPGAFNSIIAVRGDVTSNLELSGVAAVADATLTVVPSQLRFPRTNNNMTSDSGVVVTNIGMPNVTITGISTDSAEFSAISYAGPTLVTAQSGSITVTFRPSSAGTHTGNLLIDSTAGRITVPLSGNGTQFLGFDTKAVTLYALKGQTNSSKSTVTFTNASGLGANLGAVTITASPGTSAFSQTNDCPAVLNAGSSCHVTVAYSPSGSTSDSATLSIVVNSNSYTLPLAGLVTDFALAASSASATVTAGQAATYPVTINNSGGYSGNLTFSCSGAPAYSTCTVTPTTVSVSSGSTAVNVSVATTARKSASSRRPVLEYLAFAALMFGCVFVPKSQRYKAGLIVLVLSVFAFNGCGGGGGSGGPTPPPATSGTPAGTYTLTVIATTPEGATRNTALTLKVN